MWCDACHGTEVANCRCGGDLCICQNYGEAICPCCGGNSGSDDQRGNDVEDDRVSVPVKMSEAMLDAAEGEICVCSRCAFDIERVWEVILAASQKEGTS